MHAIILRVFGSPRPLYHLLGSLKPLSLYKVLLFAKEGVVNIDQELLGFTLLSRVDDGLLTDIMETVREDLRAFGGEEGERDILTLSLQLEDFV